MFYPLTGFGSALNIETLVAAAEKRETPIEVSHSLCYLLNIFIISSGLDECGCSGILICHVIDTIAIIFK